jgi:prepilin peptidase CpaA
MTMDWAPLGVVAVALVAATFTDVRTLKVHNWLTIPLFLSGLLYHAAVGGIEGFVGSLVAAAAVFGILLVPYVLGALGAGDVKLVAAIAAWLGATTAFTIGALGFLLTGIYCLGVLCIQGRLADAWLHFKVSMMRLQMVARHIGADEGERIHEMAATPEGRKRLVPFSAMIAIATILAVAIHFYLI